MADFISNYKILLNSEVSGFASLIGRLVLKGSQSNHSIHTNFEMQSTPQIESSHLSAKRKHAELSSGSTPDVSALETDENSPSKIPKNHTSDNSSNLNQKRVLQTVKKYYLLGKHVLEQNLRKKIEAVFECDEYKQLSEICYYSGYCDCAEIMFLHVARHGYIDAMKWIYHEVGGMDVHVNEDEILLWNVKQCHLGVVCWLLDIEDFDRATIERARKICADANLKGFNKMISKTIDTVFWNTLMSLEAK